MIKMHCLIIQWRPLNGLSRNQIKILLPQNCMNHIAIRVIDFYRVPNKAKRSELSTKQHHSLDHSMLNTPTRKICVGCYFEIQGTHRLFVPSGSRLLVLATMHREATHRKDFSRIKCKIEILHHLQNSDFECLPFGQFTHIRVMTS